MNWEWISEKSTSLMAGIAGLIFIAVALLDSRYRYFFLCAAVIAFYYAYKRYKKRDTPFEKHEREIRRKRL